MTAAFWGREVIGLSLRSRLERENFIGPVSDAMRYASREFPMTTLESQVFASVLKSLKQNAFCQSLSS